MFQFPGFPAYDYFIHRTLYDSSSYGFPHSDICGSTLICSSPQLFAACHVLLRLLMPRHSPCALSRLNSSSVSSIQPFSCLNCVFTFTVTQYFFASGKIVSSTLRKDLISLNLVFSLCFFTLSVRVPSYTRFRIYDSTSFLFGFQ